MSKKIKILFIIIAICIYIVPAYTAFCVIGRPEEIPADAMQCNSSGSNICNAKGKDYYGIASGLGSSGGGVQQVDTRKCGEEGKLCFGGGGVYLSLIKYDYKTKTETYVGKTVLIHHAGFLESAETQYNMKITDPHGPLPVSSTDSIYFWYDVPHVLIKYPSSRITFSPRGNGAEQNNGIKYISDNRIINDTDGYASYVNNYIANLVSEGKKNNKNAIVAIAELFDYGEEMKRFENQREYDKYYIVAEVAQRVLSSSVDGWALEGDTTQVDSTKCNPSNCKHVWSKAEEPFTVYTNATCTVGGVYQCVNFMTVDGHEDAACQLYSGGTIGGDMVCRSISENEVTTDYGNQSTTTSYPDTCSLTDSSEAGTMYVKSIDTSYKCALEGSAKNNKISNDCKDTCWMVKIIEGKVTKVSGTCNEVHRYKKKTCKIEYGKFEIPTGIDGTHGTKIVRTFRPDFEFTYGSIVTIARDTGNIKLSLRIFEEVGQKKLEHKVYDKDGKTQIGVDYYVGPNSTEAIAGTTPANKYQLVGKDIQTYNVTGNIVRSRKYTLGVAYFWLPDFEDSCRDVCSKYDSNRDELLKCAENYCDNHIGYQEWSVNVQKRNCIIQCGYTPKPNNCKTMGVEYKNQTKIENTIDDCVETWCHNDSNEDHPDENKSIDQKTYVHVGCSLGITGLTFTGPDKQSVLPGTGVDFRLNLQREKKCLVWFDEETWKLDYASLHSKDIVCLNNECTDNKASRELLIKILNDYNAAANKGDYKGEIANSISSYFDNSERPTNVQWQHTSIDFTDINGNDVAISSVIISESTKDRKLVDNVEKQLIKTNEEINNSYSSRIGVSSVVGYNRLHATGAIKVNRYLTKSSTTETFAFEKTCLTTDGKGTSYKADDSGICYKNRDQGEGKNEYYTSMQGIGAEGYVLDISAKINIRDSGKNPSTEPELTKVCERSEVRPKLSLTCNVYIGLNSGTELLGGGVYNGPNGVNATLGNSNNVANDPIKYYGLFVDPVGDDWKNYDGKTDKIDSIKPKTTVGIEPHVVKCMVKTQSGRVAYGETNIKLTNCSNTKCTIVKEGNKYVVNTNNKNASVFITTDDSPNNKLTVYLNANTSKFEFTLRTTTSDEKVKTIVATVKDSSGTYCCTYSEKQVTSCNIWNAKKDHTVGEVRLWCNENFAKAIEGYSDPIDCTKKCFGPCPMIDNCGNASIETVTNYCKTVYDNEKTENSCMEMCYRNVCSNGIIYRPIDVHNPFPNSPVSPIDKGNRLIGANWVGLTEYITDDLDDPTSLTGPNKGSEAEYIIDLTPDDIRKIREDNNKKGSLDSYTELIYSTDLDDDYQGKYRSSFVHDDDKNNGGFASIFSKMPG